MLGKQVTGHHRRDTWIAIWLGIVGALLYGLTVFQSDYIQLIERGEAAQAAIEALDQMRRPFLELKQAEVRLMESAGESSTISGVEKAIDDGRHELSQYVDLASYNKELQKAVARLEASYKVWVSLELELVRKRAFLVAGSDTLTEHRELDALALRNSSAFLAVMDVLGEGEKPIHRDIAAGTAALYGLLASSLTLIAYLVLVVFWREVAFRKRERLCYESDLQLHRLAHRDSLTGLANRVLFDDRISVAIATAHRYGHRLAILYLDLDGFKNVNDELGHDAGDSVLKEVALRLQKHTRKSDTVARLGGDEFAVLITNMQDAAGARVRADKFHAALDQPFELRGKPYLLRASIGIAIFPDDGEQAQLLLKHADAAMYEAKRMTKLNDARLRTESGSSYSTRQRIA